MSLVSNRPSVSTNTFDIGPMLAPPVPAALARPSSPTAARSGAGAGLPPGDTFTPAEKAPVALTAEAPATAVLPSMSLDGVTPAEPTDAEIATMVQDTYNSMLLRDATPEELSGWMETAHRLMDNGMSPALLKGSMLISLAVTKECSVVGTVSKACEELLGSRPTARNAYHAQALAMSDAGASVADIDTAIRSNIMGSKEYATAHVDEMCQRVFRELLGRDGGVGDWWNAQCRQKLDQGQTLAQVEAWMRQGIQGGPEYFQKHIDEVCAQIFQEVLGRPGSDKPTDYWNQVARQKLAEGMSPDQIKSMLREAHMSSDEYGLNHLDYVVNKLYQQLLNRSADPGGLSNYVGMAGQLKAQGKSLGDIKGAITNSIQASEEYQKLHPPLSTIPGAEKAISYAMNPPPNPIPGSNGDWHYWCLGLVSQAYQSAGRSIPNLAMYNAIGAYRNYESQGLVHHDGSNPPRGALVFFTWANDGHIGISLGDGRYIGTATSGAPTIINKIGGSSYLGWANP